MDHCFHSDGMVYDTYPSFSYEKCCRCGKSRRVGGRLVKASEAGHGSHMPMGEYIEVPDIEDIGPCEPASSPSGE